MQMLCLGYDRGIFVSVCLSTGHNMHFYQNEMSEDHKIFTVGCTKDSHFKNWSAVFFFQKFEKGRYVLQEPAASCEQRITYVVQLNSKCKPTALLWDECTKLMPCLLRRIWAVCFSYRHRMAINLLEFFSRLWLKSQ